MDLCIPRGEQLRIGKGLSLIFLTCLELLVLITLTADDMNWPDHRAEMNVTSESVCNLTSQQKRELLCSDPVTTARDFLQRFNKSIAYLKGPSKPIGEIVDYIWGVEFQLCRTPHIHSLWWVKKAPDL